MEIQKTEGGKDKVLMKNVVYTANQLKNRLTHDYRSEHFYTNSCYKQSPSGPELFSLPEMHLHSGGTVPLLPNKFTCDIWMNENLEIDSVFFKSVWKDDEIIPFGEWLADIEEKIKNQKQLLDETELLHEKMQKLYFQRREIDDELEKFKLYCC